jgi:hypothetical protein
VDRWLAFARAGRSPRPFADTINLTLRQWIHDRSGSHSLEHRGTAGAADGAHLAAGRTDVCAACFFLLPAFILGGLGGIALWIGKRRRHRQGPENDAG